VVKSPKDVPPGRGIAVKGLSEERVLPNPSDQHINESWPINVKSV